MFTLAKRKEDRARRRAETEAAANISIKDLQTGAADTNTPPEGGNGDDGGEGGNGDVPNFDTASFGDLKKYVESKGGTVPVGTSLDQLRAKLKESPDPHGGNGGGTGWGPTV